MPTTEHWPHNFIEMKQNRKGQTVYNFAPTQVTIKRIYEPKLDGSTMQYATGWSFNEDTTPSGQYIGVIWSHSGIWGKRGTPEEGRVVAPYPGPKGHVGAQATVSLSVTEADGRNFYNLNSITIQSEGNAGMTLHEAMDAQINAPLPAPTRNVPPHAPVEQRILQGMFFNNLTVALAAGKTAPIGDGLKHLAELTGKDPAMVWGELAAAAAAGDPLPLLMPSFKDEPEPEEAQVEEPPEEEEELPW